METTLEEKFFSEKNLGAMASVAACRLYKEYPSLMKNKGSKVLTWQDFHVNKVPALQRKASFIFQTMSGKEKIPEVKALEKLNEALVQATKQYVIEQEAYKANTQLYDPSEEDAIDRSAQDVLAAHDHM